MKLKPYVLWAAIILLLLFSFMNLLISYDRYKTTDERINKAVQDIIHQLPVKETVIDQTRTIQQIGQPGRDGQSIVGPQGQPGQNGIDGKDGQKGDPGDKGAPGEAIELKWINGILHEKYTNDDFWIEVPTEVTQ